MSWGAFGMNALGTLVENVSNRIGSGASARHQLQGEEVEQRRKLNYADVMSRVEAAKAAGLHPLAAMGINIGSSSMDVTGAPSRGISGGNYRSMPRETDQDRRFKDAQIAEMEARARQANADADVTQAQARASLGALSSQPGNAPLVAMEPRRVTRAIPGQPGDAGGVAPTQAGYKVYDAWTGQPRDVKMPTNDFGQGIENLGELWQAVLGTPYALDVLYQKYLQTPREWMTNRLEQGPINLKRRSGASSSWR